MTPAVFLDGVPANAGDTLNTLEGEKLFSFFRTVPWDTCLSEHFQRMETDDLRKLTESLVSALPAEVKEGIDVTDKAIDKEGLLEELRSCYLLKTEAAQSATAIVNAVKRAWSARKDDEEGKMLVALALDIGFIEESQHRASLPIARAIDGLGISSVAMTSGGKPTKFTSTRNRAGQSVKRLVAFWSSLVPVTSVQGFCGRYRGMNVGQRRQGFAAYWSIENVGELEANEARTLGGFLTPAGEPRSPSAAGCRAFLKSLLSSQTPQDSRPSRESKKNPITTKGKQGTKSPTVVPPICLPSANKDSSTSDGSLDTGSDSSNAFPGSLSSDSDVYEDVTPVRKSTHGTKFPGLPRKMLQVLRQGGPSFEMLFEPLRVEITTPKELYKLLRYHNDAERVKRELCRSVGLEVNPSLSAEKLELGKIWRIRPEYRLADSLSFPATSRKAPRILHRWMNHGSLVPWLNALCSKAGQVEKDNADGYLAREIMSTGLTLASLLNEFHPEQLLYSSAIERLVRRLWVMEKSLSMERQDRGAFVLKMLGFMGLGHGPIADPEELN